MLYILHAESWKDMANRTKEFKSFVNVIEDARIDKLNTERNILVLLMTISKVLIKCTKIISLVLKVKRYKLSYSLIDKINLYYKSSKNLRFQIY